MGYTTIFQGQFELDPTLTPAHKNYLKAFSVTRHVRWNAEWLDQMEDDPIRQAVGLPLGEEGLYFTGSIAFGLNPFWDHPALTSDGYSYSPAGAPPDFWCKWEPNAEGTAIQWNGMEKFHHSLQWLQFLLDHFLIPWGYTLNGQVHWQGESDEVNDEGIIAVIKNQITTKGITRPDQ